MKTSRFTGPVFIVGLPRSGTKLLRDLLNQNPKIGITSVESHIIPHMVRRFGNPPDFENDDRFDRFYEEFTQTAFFQTNIRESGRTLSKEYLLKEADRTSWESLFQVILRFYVPPGKDEDFIWGDKTPGYVRHLSLLKELYPEARFLHIIRDPRDYCLSVKKTWGKSLFRAAHRWRETLETARPSGLRLGQDYMEVSYESLLQEPEAVLNNICEFLGCEFVPNMMRLESSTEYYGDARGLTEIAQNNWNKYSSQLPPSQVKRIEEIVYPVAKSVGFELEHATEFKPISPLVLKVLKLYDGWAFTKFVVKDLGLRHGIRQFFYAYRESSWR